MCKIPKHFGRFILAKFYCRLRKSFLVLDNVPMHFCRITKLVMLFQDFLWGTLAKNVTLVVSRTVCADEPVAAGKSQPLRIVWNLVDGEEFWVTAKFGAGA
jgi:hypothetical protein